MKMRNEKKNQNEKNISKIAKMLHFISSILLSTFLIICNRDEQLSLQWDLKVDLL